MKPRTVIMQFEIETSLPKDVLLKSCVLADGKDGEVEYLHPVNKPKVEIVNATKRKK